jgi:hypothetical protein
VLLAITWTFVAIEAQTKLVLSWLVGRRGIGCATEWLQDVANRLSNRIQRNMRRFTRLTNAFSKKIVNHMHSVALFYMHDNFVRVHQTLRVTPAMEAGLPNHVWSIQDVVALANEAAELRVA